MNSHLSWRLDPRESLSDWTIVVETKHDDGDDNLPRGMKDFSFVKKSVDDQTEISEISYDERKNERRLKKAVEKIESQEQESQKYHVHQAVLGVGARKSEFFAKIFQEHREVNNKQRYDDDDDGSISLDTVTYIEVKPSAAHAFGAMLDFVYGSPDSPVEATTVSAVALRHLSIALGIRELFNRVTPFIQKDLSGETAPIYLFEAERYGHDKLLNVSLKLCATHFSELKLSSLIILSPSVFLRVLTSPHLKCESKVLSVRVASYFRCRPECLNQHNLFAFTDPNIMPRVSPDEVMFYLNKLEQTKSISKDGTMIAHSKKPTLYERCVSACPTAVENIMKNRMISSSSQKHEKTQQQQQDKGQNHDMMQRQVVESEYENTSSEIRVQLLESALMHILKAPPTIPNRNKPHKRLSFHVPPSTTGQTPQSYENNNEKIIKSYHGSSSSTPNCSPHSNHSKRREEKEKIRTMQKEYERKIASLQEKLYTKEDKLRRYQAELSKFTRVPNTYSPSPILSECTFQDVQAYDSYGESVFGNIPPTALPRMMKHPESDGWIYKEDRKTRSHCMYWPMYYYKAN